MTFCLEEMAMTYYAGNSGDDTLIGGNGEDDLRGGGGSDLFVLSPDSGLDQISDFKLGRDQIGLSNGLNLGRTFL